jgi:hypothetical protein
MEHDFEPRIDLSEGLRGGNGLREPQGIEPVDDLTMKVRDLDLVRVRDADEADACGRQIETDRGT